jgi:hypothetical protein
MKLKDNTGFGGVCVISLSPAKFLKSKGLIEGASRAVGFADFQEHGPAEHRLKQPSRNASAPVFRRDCEIQDLLFAFRNCSGDEESNDAIVEFRDQDVIAGRIPTGRVGAGLLDGRDLREVAGTSWADHFFGA